MTVSVAFGDAQRATPASCGLAWTAPARSLRVADRVRPASHPVSPPPGVTTRGIRPTTGQHHSADLPQLRGRTPNRHPSADRATATGHTAAEGDPRRQASSSTGAGKTRRPVAQTPWKSPPAGGLLDVPASSAARGRRSRRPSPPCAQGSYPYSHWRRRRQWIRRSLGASADQPLKSRPRYYATRQTRTGYPHAHIIASAAVSVYARAGTPGPPAGWRPGTAVRHTRRRTPPVASGRPEPRTAPRRPEHPTGRRFGGGLETPPMPVHAPHSAPRRFPVTATGSAQTAPVVSA